MAAEILYKLTVKHEAGGTTGLQIFHSPYGKTYILIGTDKTWHLTSKDAIELATELLSLAARIRDLETEKEQNV